MNESIKILKAKINELYANRSQDFINLYLDFVSFFDDYFKKQAIDYIDSLAHYEQIKKVEYSSEELQKLFEKTYLLWLNEWLSENKNDLLKIWVNAPDLDLLSNEFEVQYAKENAWKLITGINTTTQKEIWSIISDWIEKWLNINEIALNIKDKFAKYSLYRSTLIANQEVAMTYETWKKKSFEAMAKNMLVTWYKRSVTQHDESVRESHKQNERDWRILANKVFSWTWTDTAPHWIWCRCNTERSLTNPDTWKLYDHSLVEYSDEKIKNFNDNWWSLNEIAPLTEKQLKIKSDLKLRDEEIKAIKDYTMESSYKYSSWYINWSWDVMFTSWIPFFIWWLNKLEKFDWITYSWRKVNKIDFKYYANLKIWDSFVLNEFISSSKSEKIAEKFTTPDYKVIFKIKSSKWINIEDLSNLPNEREVLFLPKSLFYIEKVEFSDNILKISLVDLK